MKTQELLEALVVKEENGSNKQREKQLLLEERLYNDTSLKTDTVPVKGGGITYCTTFK